MYVITTAPANLYSVKEGIEHLGFKCDEASLEMIPKTLVDCDEENIKANLALIDWLEQLDDVDSVYHNMNLPDDLIE